MRTGTTRVGEVDPSTGMIDTSIGSRVGAGTCGIATAKGKIAVITNAEAGRLSRPQTRSQGQGTVKAVTTPVGVTFLRMWL